MNINPIKYTARGMENVKTTVGRMQVVADATGENVYTYFNSLFLLANPGGSAEQLIADFCKRAAAKQAQRNK